MIKTISGAEPLGYSLNMPTYSGLSITSTGSIGGTGVLLKDAGTMINAGHIAATTNDGIFMKGGGGVSNSGSVDGYIGVWAPNVSEGGGGAMTTVVNSGVLDGQANGVQLNLGGNVTNSGSISETSGGYATSTSDAVYDLAGAVYNTGKLIASNNKAAKGFHSGVEIGSGTVTNGGLYGSHTALIAAYYGVTALGTTTVNNYASISGVDAGVQFEKDGKLVNGGNYDTTALIKAQIAAVRSASGSVYNYAVIDGGLIGVSFGGSSLVNGSATDQGALIEGGGAGLEATSAASTIMNWGTIEGVNPPSNPSSGIRMNGGALTNGATNDTSALIEAYGVGVGVDLGGAVTNFGVIEATDAGMAFYAGGRLTNGSAASHAALIEGGEGVTMKGAAGTVANFGTIRALAESGPDSGIYLAAGGSVTNGDIGDKSAAIKGQTGVFLAAVGSVTNYGAIDGATYDGVRLAGGGLLVNGAPTDPGAVIDGYFGVVLVASGTVDNFGTVESAPTTAAAVHEAAGGDIVNGSAGDRTALLTGGQGASFTGGAGTLTNYATITGASGAGVLATAGANITNGGGADRVALIQGDNGVDVSGGAGAITNFATIVGLGGTGFFGAYLQAGGALVNGSINDHDALIQGYGGAEILGPGASINFGTLQSLGATSLGFGLDLAQNGDLTNGATTDASALIEGYFGAELSGDGTLTNFGTIAGANGVAVTLVSSAATLAVEAGSSFLGSVNGDGGILDLASGDGTIVLAGSAVTVSGSMAATKFSSFATVRIAAGASFKVSGDNTGALVVLGGTLTSDGTVSGAGHLNINGGIADMGAGFTENVFFGTTGELKLGSSKTYTGKITGFSLTGKTSLDLLDIAFAGTTTAHYSGTTTSGVLTVTEGANTAKITLEGDYLSSTFTLSAAPGGGTLVVDPPKAATPAHVTGPVSTHQFIAAMAGFTAPAGPSGAVAAEAWRIAPPILATPRAA